MRNAPLISASIALVAAAACFPAQAQTVWDEGVNGDLSNNGLEPTPLSIINSADMRVIGTMGNAGNGVDRDYFTFTVPVGARLDAIWINPSSFVPGSFSFMAVQAGPQVTATPTGGGFEALLGFTNFDNADVGTNILPRLIQSSPGLGGVLQSGTYSIWLQDDGGTVPYDITFSIGAVPEVSTAWLFAAGALALAMRRRRAR